MHKIGPYSRPVALAKLDGRSREARLLKAVRVDLSQHLGGKASATQRALIDRAAWLTLHVAQMDAKTAAGRALTEMDSRQYLAWSNSLTRTLCQLGIKGTEIVQKSLADHLADHAA